MKSRNINIAVSTEDGYNNHRGEDSLNNNSLSDKPESLVIGGKRVVPSKEYFVRFWPSVAVNIGPAGLGNYMASSTSGLSDASKALLSILAGLSAGYKMNDATKQYAVGPYTATALLAAGGLSSAGASYLARRILDWKQKKVKTSGLLKRGELPR